MLDVGNYMIQNLSSRLPADYRRDRNSDVIDILIESWSHHRYFTLPPLNSKK